MKRRMKPCHYIYVKDVGKVFIPGCMGGAVYGIDRCTCDREKYKKDLETRIEILEEKMKKIIQKEKSFTVKAKVKSVDKYKPKIDTSKITQEEK